MNFSFDIVTHLQQVSRYSSDKLRGLLVDIKMHKNCNGTWCRKPCLIGENRQNKYLGCDVTSVRKNNNKKKNNIYFIQNKVITGVFLFSNFVS